MKKIAQLLAIGAIALSSATASASVSLSNLNATATNISFDLNGSVTKIGANYQHQFGFGHVSNPDLDWISSFDGNASSVTVNSPTKQTVDSIYDLSGPYGESVWTVSGSTWALGDQISLHYNLVGNFNLANFHVNELGFQVGYTSGKAVDPNLNILEAPASDVPEPASLALFGLGLAGAGLVRRKRG